MPPPRRPPASPPPPRARAAPCRQGYGNYEGLEADPGVVAAWDAAGDEDGPGGWPGIATLASRFGRLMPLLDKAVEQVDKVRLGWPGGGRGAAWLGRLMSLLHNAVGQVDKVWRAGWGCVAGVVVIPPLHFA